jgi:hypothetical protein
MKMKLLALAVVAASGVVALKTPAVAHHAFSAEFDANLPVRLGGPITRVEWINPHTWIHLENSDAESTRDPGAWMVEGGTPNTVAAPWYKSQHTCFGNRYCCYGISV